MATRADILRGEYGRYRSNNDRLSYHLDIRVDPTKKFISGRNAIRFKMLQDDTRIQLELYANLQIDKILLGQTPLKYQREAHTVWVDFPQPLKAGRTYTIDFHYSGLPLEIGRFGGITFRQDAAGHPWINTACEGDGSSVWWPNKDQWRDEVRNMRLSVAVPHGLMDISNGKFLGKADLGDGYTRWRATRHGDDRIARMNLMSASMQGAMAFQKGLGCVHSLSHSLGGVDPRLHHGTLNAMFLPTVIAFNAEAGSVRDEGRMQRLAQAMDLHSPSDIGPAIVDMNARLGLPSGLRAMGVEPGQFGRIVAGALADHCHKTNPRLASAEDYLSMLESAM